MKYIKSFLFFVMAAAFTLAGCNDQDDLQDRVDALGNRVTALEEQVKILNENLETLGTLLNMENMKTIKDVQTDNGQYTITLSDNTVLSLTIGVQGTAREPEITIDEDGEWVVNGKPMGVSAVGQAGANGSGYPEFRVNDGKWQVRFVDASETPGDWQDVEGNANTGIGEIGDQIIAGVEVTDTQLTITYYTAYSEGTTKTISLPIVPDLTCEIVTAELLDDEGYLLMEAGTVQTLEVKIKGGTPQLTYPSKWRATIESTDTEGVYELAIYAPDNDASAASAGSRVSANNMEDVTVRVQKGTYWAVDKVKVKIGSSEPVEPTYNSVYEKYQAGQDITIGGYTFNRESGLSVTHVTASDDVTLANGVNGVYIIDTDATLNFPSNLLDDVSNLILLSNDLEGDKAKVNIQVDNSVSVRIHDVTDANVIAQNIEFTTGCLVIDLNSTTSFVNNLIIDGCKLTLPDNRHLFNGDKGADNSIKNIKILNSNICIKEKTSPSGVSTSRLLNFAVTGKCIDVNADIDIDNNVFYTQSTSYRNNGAILSIGVDNEMYGDFQGSISITDNTFVNMSSSGQGGLLRAQFVNNPNITINGCLFWDNVENTTQNACRLLNTMNKVSPIVNINNIKAYSKLNDGSPFVTYQYYYQSNKPADVTNVTITQEADDPLQTANFETGEFVVKAGVNCGATR